MQNQQLKELTDCYDAQASHFHNTRGFHKRPELPHIKTILDKQSKLSPSLLRRQERGVDAGKAASGSLSKKLKLLDLGCGTGRIFERLKLEELDTYTYTGVDISAGMIAEAKKQYKKGKFEVNNMTDYLQTAKQQSVDVILCLAAFHHLQTKQERLQVLHNMYRALNYGGLAILVNWSFSHRFIEKYRTPIIQSILKSIGTIGTSKWNDIIIPWKDPNFDTNQEVHHRFYHIHTLQELKTLISTTDFQTLESCYITQDGKKNYHRHDSRNSFVVLRKGRY